MPEMGESAARFDSLYQLFSRKYSLETMDLSIGENKITIFHLPDTDQLLDELLALGPEHEAVKDERLPYWADIWPSSIALSEVISEMPDLIVQKQVLDLGCGVGLTGLVATQIGGEVTITDYQEDALRLSELNWLMNIKKSPEAFLMDWRNPEPDKKYDTILASDVVYEKRFFQALVRLFEQCLTPGGTVLLSEPNRTIAGEFFVLLQKYNFRYEKFDRHIIFRDKGYDIGVYVISQ
jgi:predicted nicotinamide N-methyase